MDSPWTALLDVLSDAICLLNGDHTIVRCNLAMQYLMEKSEQEMQGRKCWELLWGKEGHPECPVFRMEKTLRRESAEIKVAGRWFEVTVDPIFDDRGTLVHILHSLRCIDERKCSKMELEKTAKRFRAMIDTAPYGAHLYELQSDDRLIFMGANTSADTILGISNAQFIGKTIEEAFPNLSRTEIPDAYRAVAMTGKPFNTEQVVYSDDRGISGAFEVCAFQTSPAHVAVLFRDITEKKRQEEAIRASQEEVYRERERLAVTLRSIGDGVITTDTQGRVVFLNPIAEQMTGWSNAEAFGRALAEVFHIVDEFTRKPCENPVEKVLKTGRIVELANHTLLISRDGREMVLADSGSPIRDECGVVFGVVLVFRDITEKQKIIEAMQQTQRLESLGILAGGIAHDFNNLLGGIFGYIELALTDKQVGKETSEYLQSAMRVLNRARDLTHQLLTFSKGGTPVRTYGSIQKTVKECASFALSGSNVTSRFSFADDLWDCEYDENQIGQVIDNIVLNAQQAMPMGGKIDISVDNRSIEKGSHRWLKPGNYLEITVRDYGIGIPKEIVERIFDPFFTTKQKGHGLGLATAFSIVQKHDGAIEVESEPGKGSSFHIYLPASFKKDVVSPAEERKSFQYSGRILLMDDEEFMRDVLSSMLQKLGYESVCAQEGEEVLERIAGIGNQEPKIDAIILDLTIPGGMGGKEVIAKIRERDKTTPVIVASGYSDDPVMAKPKEYGFSGSITKPFTIEEIGKVLHEVLSGSAAWRR